MIHYHIPDPSPVEIGREEATQLAREVVRAVAAYLPDEERARALNAVPAAPERIKSASGDEFRETGQLEVYSHPVDGAPGCCVGIRGKIVCVKVAE
jgi:hypothetical protein